MAVSTWEPFLSFEGIQGQQDKNGIRVVRCNYYVPTLAMAMNWVPPDLEKTIGLPIYGPREWSQEWGNGRLIDQGKDGAFKVAIQLQGVDEPKEEESGVFFDSDGTMSEEGIEAHPEIDFLMEKYDGKDTPDGRIEFALRITVDGKEIINPLFGWKKFHSPGLIWTKTHVTLRPSSSVTGRLGKIDRPPTGPGGFLPHLEGRQNWLKIVGKTSWRGNVWKVTESWMSSGIGGQWNEDVYR